MENTGPELDAAAAREALADIERTQQDLRHLPWPWWLHAGNAALLGLWGLVPLLDAPYRMPLWFLASAAVVAFNLITGYRTGAPWVVPKPGFLMVSVVLASLCVLASLMIAMVADDVAPHTAPAWPHVALAAAAALLVVAGSVSHTRATAR